MKKSCSLIRDTLVNQSDGEMMGFMLGMCLVVAELVYVAVLVRDAVRLHRLKQAAVEGDQTATTPTPNTKLERRAYRMAPVTTAFPG